MEIISVCTLSCNEVSFFRILHYLLIWFFFLLFHLLPQRLSVTEVREQFAVPAECKRSNKHGEKKGWRGLTVRDVNYELPNQELGWSSSNTGKAQCTVQEAEGFCLVSAAGCCTLPTYNSAWLDYPFYSGLKTACKFFYHSFPDCVECIVAFAFLCPHLFSKLITFMLLGSFKKLCLFPSRKFIFYLLK